MKDGSQISQENTPNHRKNMTKWKQETINKNRKTINILKSKFLKKPENKREGGNGSTTARHNLIKKFSFFFFGPTSRIIYLFYFGP